LEEELEGCKASLEVSNEDCHLLQGHAADLAALLEAAFGRCLTHVIMHNELRQSLWATVIYCCSLTRQLDASLSLIVFQQVRVEKF